MVLCITSNLVVVKANEFQIRRRLAGARFSSLNLDPPEFARVFYLQNAVHCIGNRPGFQPNALMSNKTKPLETTEVNFFAKSPKILIDSADYRFPVTSTSIA
jgi:hypothetical protein